MYCNDSGDSFMKEVKLLNRVQAVIPSNNIIILATIQEYDPDVIYTKLIKDVKSIFHTVE